MFFVEHFILGPAGAAPLLPADFFLFLPFPAFYTQNFFFKFIAQVAAGKKAVRSLQAGCLAFDFDSGRRMAQLYAGGGFIDLLATGAGAADEVFRQLLLANAQRGHPFVELFPFFLCDHSGNVTIKEGKAEKKKWSG